MKVTNIRGKRLMYVIREYHHDMWIRDGRILMLLVALGLATRLATQTGLVHGQKADSLVVHVESDSSNYSIGTPVAIKISGTNRGSTLLTFDWPTSCVYDFAVTDSSGKEVFKLSRNVVCAQVVTRVKMEPGETISYDARWNQIDDAGNPVKPGEHRLLAWLVGHRSENAVTFRLGNSTIAETTTAQTVNKFTSLGAFVAAGTLLIAGLAGIAKHRRRT